MDRALDVSTKDSSSTSHEEEPTRGSSASESEFTSLREDSSSSEAETHNPVELSHKLQALLTRKLTDHENRQQQILRVNGRLSLLTRYWLPTTAIMFSSGTILRIIVKRRAAIQQWIRELGATTKDFLINWVLEPIKKVIGTIRHDESSEVSIMSKRSLEGDRDSLERMVLDFTADNPIAGESSPSDLESLKARVREGDLTPILKAYEKDLQRPLYGSIRGNLVRTLLIQIQKTKVDVEVAMHGIDSILKSQELVFG